MSPRLILPAKMCLSVELKQQISHAIEALGYEHLSEDISGALSDLQEALVAVHRGSEPKQARYQLYQNWAERAGCQWGTGTQFRVSSSEAHSLVKQVLPDKAVA